MLIAGEASGDRLGAELVRALRGEFAKAEALPTPDYQPLQTSLEAQFFGAGGPQMAAAGVELAVDLTAHAVIGLSDVFKNIRQFRRLFRQLYQLALERQPDAIICVDFSGFNRRFAHAVKRYARKHADWFHDWDPRIVQYVSPQVWASREGRAEKMARDIDLLLSMFAFEQAWYARRAPQLRVEFVGNPIVDRYASAESRPRRAEGASTPASPSVLLLPGSRPGELRRHLPLLVKTARQIAAARAATFRMVLPDESLASHAKALDWKSLPCEVQIGRLEEALRQADVAITKSGTITLECAYYGVPAVVFYRTSWFTYWVARSMATVKHIAMPNLLADEEVFPEFIQGAATAENLAQAALELLDNADRRAKVKAKLAEVSAALGPPGASRRAARAILRALGETSPPDKNS